MSLLYRMLLAAGLLLPRTFSAQNPDFPPKQKIAAQEDCGNGLDDDGDGYVDCFDLDCPCADTPACSIPFPHDPGNGISIRLAWRSPNEQNLNLGVPITANLDPQTDNIPEIIVAASNQKTGVNHMLKFFRGDGSNASAPDSMHLTTLSDLWMFPVVGDIDDDGIPELIVTESDRYIRVYRNYTPGVYPAMTLWMTSDLPARAKGMRPMLADLDGEGTPEVIAGDEVFIFDFKGPGSPLLRKVLDANSFYGQTMNRNTYGSFQVTSSCPAVADLLTPADCGGDPDCNGPEIVAGPVIYSIDLDTTDGDGFQIKVARNLNLMTAADQWEDGYTSTADLNLDGIPDIAVLGRRVNAAGPPQAGLYTWNKNGLIKFMPFPYAGPSPPAVQYSHGYPTIANVFNDMKLGSAKDFPEIIVSGDEYLMCYNLHAFSFPAYSAWWYLTPPPSSLNGGYMGPIVYDFNGDGLYEIVTESWPNIKILYGGSYPFPPGVDAERVWAQIGPETNSDYDPLPIVADVDNDGQAEIALIGYEQNFTDATLHLNVFEGDLFPWPECRNLWNQFNYNVVNVEDDLGIPAQMQPHWKELPGPGSGKRPLNMFLGQVPSLGPDQTPRILLPDLSVQVDSFRCEQDQLRINLRVCNTGSVNASPGVDLQWYQGNPLTSATPIYQAAQKFPATVPIDSCLAWALTLPMPANGILYGIINDNGSVATPIDLVQDFPATTQPECDYTNNLFSVNITYTSPVLDLGPDQTTCPNTTIPLNAGAGFARYRWQDGSTDSSYTAPNPGKYWVDAWDLCDNLFSDTLIIASVQMPALALGSDRSLCLGDSLTLSAPGFDAVAWAADSGLICGDCPAITLQPALSLTVRAIAKTGACTVQDTLRIEVVPLPEISGTATPTTCGLANGSIDLNVAGGTPPFQIQWPGSQNGASLGNLPAGQYSALVTDAAGCQANATFSVGGSSGVTLSDTTWSAIPCAGANSGQIVVALSGGLLPYQFNWSTGPGNNTLSNLAAGTYLLTATDAGGCSVSAQFVLGEPAPLMVTSVIDPTSCNSTTGNITAIAQGGTAPYTFAWNGGQTTPALNQISPGTYTVTVHDANGCSLTQTFNIAPGGSPVLINSLVTPVRCFGENNGQIATVFNGGLPPYQFNWSNGPGSGTLQNLAAGAYTLTTSDANGCSSTVQFQVAEPPALTLSAIVDSTSCLSATGGISLTAQGGTAPHSFHWNTAQSGPALTLLPPGAYTVTIGDANGCSLTQTFNIAPGGPPALINSLVTPVRCFGENNGQIATVFNGGLPPYQFNWSNGPGSGVLQNLAAGTYELTATDANGCSATASFSLPEPDELVLSILVSPIACAGQTGEIEATAQGGTGPYGFSWNNNLVGPVLSGQPAGNYTVTVTDNGGCTEVQSMSLAAPPALTVSVAVVSISCNVQGSIGLTPQGGVAPYSFTWNTGATGAILSGLAPGMYSATTTDANGCSILKTVVLDPGNTPALTDSVVVPVHCFGENNGSISVGISGGALPYLFQWSNSGAGNTQTNLSAGTYLLTVTDAAGCSLALPFSVGQPPALTANILVAADTCGQNTGALHLIAGGGTAPYNFLWPDSQTTPDRIGLAAGNWSVTLTDAQGCTLAHTATVPAVDLPPAFSLRGDTITCLQTTALLTASPAVSDWTYHWATPAGGLLDGPLQSVSTAGQFEVTVTNNWGCSAVQSLVVQADTVAPEAVVAAGEVFLPCGQSSTALLDGSGSTLGAGILARWQRMDQGQALWDTLARVAAANGPGTYRLLLVDTNNGCTDYANVFVLAPDVINGVAIATDSVTCFGLADGAIHIDGVAGGSPPFTYALDNLHFSDKAVFSGLPAGEYTVFVHGGGDCNWEGVVVVGQPDSFSVVLQASDSLLDAGQTVQLKATVLPQGLSLTQLEWLPATLFGQQQGLVQTVAPLETTLFEIRISDPHGCTATSAVWVAVAQIAVYLPNSIYPDHPGNDIFTVSAGADVRRVRLLRIFDRWGELVFERLDFPPNDPALGWNGSFRGRPAAPGVYAYHLIVELADGQTVERAGDVSILR